MLNIYMAGGEQAGGAALEAATPRHWMLDVSGLSEAEVVALGTSLSERGVERMELPPEWVEAMGSLAMRAAAGEHGPLASHEALWRHLQAGPFPTPRRAKTEASTIWHLLFGEARVQRARAAAGSRTNRRVTAPLERELFSRLFVDNTQAVETHVDLEVLRSLLRPLPGRIEGRTLLEIVHIPKMGPMRRQNLAVWVNKELELPEDEALPLFGYC